MVHVIKQHWHSRYLSLAKEVATWSKDPSSKIGAIAVGNKGQVLAQGYNGFPRGISHAADRLNDRGVKYKYVVHAEMNLIYNATYTGVSLDDSTVYVWGLPCCSECAKGLIQVGVRQVIMPEMTENTPQTWIDSFKFTAELFKEAKVDWMFIGSNDDPSTY